MPEAQPYLHLYHYCSDQYITGPGGAIGLNFLAVEKVMKYLEVPVDERIDFYDRVRFIASIVLEEQYKEQELNRKKK